MTPEELENSMHTILNGYLNRYESFSMETVTWKTGFVTRDMFREYLKKCVKNGTITEKKDEYGVTWYSRPFYVGNNKLYGE